MDFLEFNILDILDIILVAFLLFQLYKLTKGTVAIRIFIGIAAIYLIWKLVEALQMELLSEILGQFIGVGVLAVIIVFQQELRRFLLMIGNTKFFSKEGVLKFSLETFDHLHSLSSYKFMNQWLGLSTSWTIFQNLFTKTKTTCHL